METLVVAILTILSATLIICLPIVLLFWVIARKRSDRHLSANEEERLRQIWNGLQRMEQRVENLETILTAQQRTRQPGRGSGADVGVGGDPHSRNS